LASQLDAALTVPSAVGNRAAYSSGAYPAVGLLLGASDHLGRGISTGHSHVDSILGAFCGASETMWLRNSRSAFIG